MKNSSTQKNSGSILLATMVFVWAVAAFMVSYLLLVQNSDQSVARAQQWNAALPLAEAGIEQGLANLNAFAISSSSNSTSFGSLSGKLNNGTYSVSDAASGATNIITSTGSVIAPITGATITRTVQITAQRQGLFSKGMVSMTFITMKGKSSDPVASNSYDSRKGPYNSNTSGTNGDVAALNGFVNLGNHTINGNLYLGPNTPYQSGLGQVTGTIYQDWNMVFPDVTSLPTLDASGNPLPTVWPDAPSGATHTFTQNGYYTIRDNSSITVAPGVTVTLDVKPSNYDLSQSSITINGGTTNAGTVIMYQESGSVTLGGNSANGAVNNQPKNFVYFGMTGVTSMNFKGTTAFTGVVYAPEADLTLSGGGNNNGLMGSFVVRSLTLNGGYNFHFDTSLLGYFWGYYVASSWREL